MELHTLMISDSDSLDYEFKEFITLLETKSYDSIP